MKVGRLPFEPLTSIKCPGCGWGMVKTRVGWECLNPDCDVIRVVAESGYSERIAKVVRRTRSSQ